MNEQDQFETDMSFCEFYYSETVPPKTIAPNGIVHEYCRNPIRLQLKKTESTHLPCDGQACGERIPGNSNV